HEQTGRDENRAHHFGEDRQDQGQACAHVEGIFDKRQLRLEVEQLGQPVNDQEENGGADPQKQQTDILSVFFQRRIIHGATSKLRNGQSTMCVSWPTLNLIVPSEER